MSLDELQLELNDIKASLWAYSQVSHDAWETIGELELREHQLEVLISESSRESSRRET